MVGIKIMSQSSGKDCSWNTTNVNKLLMLNFKIAVLSSLAEAKGQ